MRPRHALLALALAVPACAPALHTSVARRVVVERLFFGRNVQGTPAVTDSAWAVFLAEVVTPRFPGGFTQWPASGQWRGEGGRLEREGSYVLELVHAASTRADSAVAAIINEYQRRFAQEAVLRVVMPGRANF